MSTEIAQGPATKFQRHDVVVLDMPGNPHHGREGRIIFEPTPSERVLVVVVDGCPTAHSWPAAACRATGDQKG